MKKKKGAEEINIKEEYIKLMNDLIKKQDLKLNKNIDEIITYLYNNNDKDKFIILLNDLYESFADENNKEHIENIISNTTFENINKISTYNLCPYKNKQILEIVMKKEAGKNIEYNNFTTDYICKKCKHDKTICKFVHRRLGLDENSDTIATCVNCGYSWKV